MPVDADEVGEVPLLVAIREPPPPLPRAEALARVPEDGRWPVWPFHIDVATKELKAFCEKHGLRQITFNDLRASFATECYRRGMTPAQESRIVGHGVAVAEKHYLEYEADEAREKLPPDPLTEMTEMTEDEPDAASDAKAVM